MAQEAEGHQAKSEDGWSQHHSRRTILQIRNAKAEVIAHSMRATMLKPSQ